MRRIAIIHNCRTRSIPDGSKSKIGEEGGGGGCFCDHGVRSLHVYLTMFHMNTLPICIEKGAETKLIADSVLPFLHVDMLMPRIEFVQIIKSIT